VIHRGIKYLFNGKHPIQSGAHIFISVCVLKNLKNNEKNSKIIKKISVENKFSTLIIQIFLIGSYFLF